MKTFTVVSVAALVFFLGGASLVSAAEGIEGNVRVLKVKGDVTATNSATQSTEPLKEGVFIQQGHVLKTGKDSQAWLLFSNGTTLTVQPNSTFSVEKFLQTPFDSSKTDYKKTKTEPSISQTKISISEGSIIADVAKLNKGSTFKIGTPVGVAGIRGTIIQVTVNTTAGGQRSVTVNLPEGLADFSAVNGQQFTLNNGQTVTVSIDPATNSITLGNVNPLSAQTVDQIKDLVDQVLAVVPEQQAFEGVSEGAPEVENGGNGGADNGAGGFGGNQGTGDVGTPTGGSGGGGGGGSSSKSTPTPTPTPNPPIS